MGFPWFMRVTLYSAWAYGVRCVAIWQPSVPVPPVIRRRGIMFSQTFVVVPLMGVSARVQRILDAKGILRTRKATPKQSGSAIRAARANLSKFSRWIPRTARASITMIGIWMM